VCLFLGGCLGGIICNCIRWGTELMWWEKMLLSFIITLVISIIINMRREKVNKDINVNKDKEIKEMSFKDRKDRKNKIDFKDNQVIQDILVIKDIKDIKGVLYIKDKMNIFK
jgi:hypothetical protein